MMQSKSVRKHSKKEPDNRVVLIVLLMLISLVIVLVWIALMYDKLLANSFLAILLVLGVLVILFGGTIRFGPIKIQKAVVKNRSEPETPTRTRSLTVKTQTVQVQLSILTECLVEEG